MPSKSIIYYSDSRLEPRIAVPVREQLLKIGLPIVSATLEPLDFGKNIHVNEERSYLTMFHQILACLEESDADIVYHCEHDNLMHPSHFDFTPPKKNVFYYDLNWWKVRSDGFAIHWDAEQVSGLCYYRELGIEYYRKRIENFDPDNFDRKFEPMSGEGSKDWWAKYPSIDIRHRQNLTYNKWSIDDFRKKETAKNLQESTIDKIEGWGKEQLEFILSS